MALYRGVRWARIMGPRLRSYAEGVDRCLRALSRARLVRSEGNLTAQRLLQAVPSVRRDSDETLCREHREAQAFAMTPALHERSVFTWSEWAAALTAEIKRAQAAGDPDTGETYYSHWLNTLEKLVAEKGVTTQDALHRYRDAWDRACDRTPHGKPIELRKEDFA